MKTKVYTFTVYLTGYGSTPEEAWEDAVEAIDSGIDWPFEDDCNYSEEEVDDNEDENS